MALLSDELIQLCHSCTDMKLALRLSSAAKWATKLETDARRMKFRLQGIQDAVLDDELEEYRRPIKCETPRGEVVHVQFRKEPCGAA